MSPALRGHHVLWPARLAFCLLALVAVSSASGAPASGEPQREWMLHVYPENGTFHYAPDRVEVRPGGSVTLGHLFGRHSLTSPDGLFNETGDATGWPTVVAPLQPGTYRFYCWLHANATSTAQQGMAGVMVVAEPQPAVRAATGYPATWALLAVGFALVSLRGRGG